MDILRASGRTNSLRKIQQLVAKVGFSWDVHVFSVLGPDRGSNVFLRVPLNAMTSSDFVHPWIPWIAIG